MAPKFDVTAALRERDKIDLSTERLLAMEVQLKEVTRLAYYSERKHLSKYAAGTNKDYLSKDDFICLLTSAKNQGLVICCALRSTLNFFQHSERFLLEPGAQPWANDPEIVKLTKGFEIQARFNSAKKPRGTITETHFAELKECAKFHNKGCTIKKYPRMILAIESIRMFGLRLSQFQAWIYDSLREDSGKTYLRVERDKRAQQAAQYKGIQSEVHWKLLDEDQVSFFKKVQNLQHLRRDKGKFDVKRAAKDLMFDIREAPAKLIREIIDECSKTYSWDPELEWDGPHCLRYGFVSGEVSKNSDMETLKQKCQQSPAMIKKYSETNESKVLKHLGKQMDLRQFISDHNAFRLQQQEEEKRERSLSEVSVTFKRQREPSEDSELLEEWLPREYLGV